jgi:hypothetical protein
MNCELCHRPTDNPPLCADCREGIARLVWISREQLIPGATPMPLLEIPAPSANTSEAALTATAAHVHDPVADDRGFHCAECHEPLLGVMEL